MSLFTAFLNILLLSFVELFYLVGILIAVGMVIGVIERYSNGYLVMTFGPRGLLLTAWIGTPIHEIGHLIQCFIWGHRVTKVKLLQFGHPNGVLGYVEHQYSKSSIYQQIGNFFIGLGPIFSGIGSLIVFMYFLMPESYEVVTTYIKQHVSFETLGIDFLKIAIGSVITLCKSMFTVKNLINPLFWGFLVIVICISSHTALSKEDIKGSARGLIYIFFLLVIINIISGIFGFNSHQIIVKVAEINTYILAFSSIAVFFSLLTLFLSSILYMIKVVST